MFNQEKDRTIPRTFHGFFRGQVIDVADPLYAGRVRVRINGVYDDIADTSLPWALYADPLMGGGINSGGFFIPDVGDDVWCFFENSDHMYPVFFAGAPCAVDMPNEKTSSGSTYASNRIFKTKQGHVLEFDDTQGNSRIRVHHKSGTEIIMSDNGDMTETVVGNLTRTVTGNINETVSGSVTRTITGDNSDSIGGSNTENVTGSSNLTVSGSITESASMITVNNATVTPTGLITSPTSVVASNVAAGSGMTIAGVAIADRQHTHDSGSLVAGSITVTGVTAPSNG